MNAPDIENPLRIRMDRACSCIERELTIFSQSVFRTTVASALTWKSSPTATPDSRPCTGSESVWYSRNVCKPGVTLLRNKDSCFVDQVYGQYADLHLFSVREVTEGPFAHPFPSLEMQYAAHLQ
jgi:hypothetical protein